MFFVHVFGLRVFLSLLFFMSLGLGRNLIDTLSLNSIGLHIVSYSIRYIDEDCTDFDSLKPFL